LLRRRSVGAVFFDSSGIFFSRQRKTQRGLTVNLPLLAGSGDGEYTVLFEKVLKPIALEFKPELIFVSAGFDIHVDDPLGGMRVTLQGFAALTRSILDTAKACCQGKVVMTLEGGYDLRGLAESVRTVLRELAGLQKADLEEIIAKADARRLIVLLSRIKRIHGRHWPRLAKSLAHGLYPKPSIVERLMDATARVAAYLKN
jgi:acetoin utilization deacetylase AcuC-like enzyme